jgi:hypothetical protein
MERRESGTIPTVGEPDDDPGYESGPFCLHGGEIGDGCQEVCACRHKCCEHSFGARCRVAECRCEDFTTPPA